MEMVAENYFESLSAQDLDIKQELYTQLIKMMDLSVLETMDSANAEEQITEACNHLLNETSRPLNLSVRQKIIKLIIDEILGLGPLETLFADPTISDILVNSFDNIFVERHGKLERVPVQFYDNSHLLNIIDRIVSGVGRRIDESSPMVDARLKDGSRVNAIIPPLALDGPSLSIRRFTVEKLRAHQLVEYRSMSEEIGKLIQAAVHGKLNILISGGTGSGKTTLLNILSGYIPSDERIITIEDSAELQLQQPHVVRLETRVANIEGVGEVMQRDLVKNCLRMRPDRIVIGEVRGAEAIDMLAAMNTGHEGSLTTLHANSPRDALSRLENMVCMGGIDMPVHNIRAQIASAIDLVVQLQRQEDGKRRITSVSEINGMEGDVITMSEIFTFQRRGKTESGDIIGEFKATGVVPNFHKQILMKGIDLPHSVFGVDIETINF
ncbi:CpaF family protein [Thalassotalea sp. HSM 43]|uniref:CpaF family protein n=1 Tax=Thalassotalea sp. HSM 43 TaxID=2552945 RepID=UPI001081EF76|nr:CpaF family protein [Thalassotalea sp. HSM 43]QBY03434.1 CpaF family protein [Thalassotalea sp. HSM 43]